MEAVPAVKFAPACLTIPPSASAAVRWPLLWRERVYAERKRHHGHLPTRLRTVVRRLSSRTGKQAHDEHAGRVIIETGQVDSKPGALN